ncbi:hypothetical protein DSECCO2_238630 [anaerobic digester metagenome]
MLHIGGTVDHRVYIQAPGFFKVCFTGNIPLNNMDPGTEKFLIVFTEVVEEEGFKPVLRIGTPTPPEHAVNSALFVF